MKINQVNHASTFTPVAVTFETEAELAFFIRVLGVTTQNISRTFGIQSKEHFNAYKELRAIIGNDRIQKYPTFTLSIKQQKETHEN